MGLRGLFVGGGAALAHSGLHIFTEEPRMGCAGVLAMLHRVERWQDDDFLRPYMRRFLAVPTVRWISTPVVQDGLCS